MNYKSQVTRKETDLVKGGMSGNSLATRPKLKSSKILNASHLPSWLSFFVFFSFRPSRPVLRLPKIPQFNYHIKLYSSSNPVLSLYNAIKSSLNPLAKFRLISP